MTEASSGSKSHPYCCFYCCTGIQASSSKQQLKGNAEKVEKVVASSLKKTLSYQLVSCKNIFNLSPALIEHFFPYCSLDSLAKFLLTNRLLRSQVLSDNTLKKRKKEVLDSFAPFWFQIKQGNRPWTIWRPYITSTTIEELDALRVEERFRAFKKQLALADENGNRAIAYLPSSYIVKQVWLASCSSSNAQDAQLVPAFLTLGAKVNTIFAHFHRCMDPLLRLDPDGTCNSWVECFYCIKTPLNLAVMGRNNVMLQCLAHHGANIYHRPEIGPFGGSSALLYALATRLSPSKNTRSPLPEGNIDEVLQFLSQQRGTSTLALLEVIHRLSWYKSNLVTDYPQQCLEIANFLLERGEELEEPLIKEKISPLLLMLKEFDTCTPNVQQSIRDRIHELAMTLPLPKNCLNEIAILPVNQEMVLVNAMKQADLSLFKKLREKGVNINWQDGEGKTPLMHLVLGGSISYDKTHVYTHVLTNLRKKAQNILEIVIFEVSGVNYALKDKAEKTALDYAKDHDQEFFYYMNGPLNGEGRQII